MKKSLTVMAALALSRQMPPIHASTFIQVTDASLSSKKQKIEENTIALVKKNCEANLPICIGMINAPSYGNHWVSVYQIRENGEHKGHYKCVDHWYDYKKEIQTSWTIEYARLYQR